MSSCMALVLIDWGVASITIVASSSWRSRTALAELLGELGKRLEQVGDQAVIRNLEDRGLFVLVDGDDHLGVLHAGEVLDGAGDADRDVELGRHHLAGLPNLPIVGSIAGVDRGARGADRGAELVGDRLDVFRKNLAGLHGAPARGHELWPRSVRG